MNASSAIFTIKVQIVNVSSHSLLDHTEGKYCSHLLGEAVTEEVILENINSAEQELCK